MNEAQIISSIVLCVVGWACALWGVECAPTPRARLIAFTLGALHCLPLLSGLWVAAIAG
ncbi:MAG: hypothetical protein RJA99_3138 [Pseudomonadota bacterium]|jgi:hypothetical protein